MLDGETRRQQNANGGGTKDTDCGVWGGGTKIFCIIKLNAMGV